MRARLIVLRDAALGKDFDAGAAVGLSHAIRALHFVIEGKEFEEDRS